MHPLMNARQQGVRVPEAQMTGQGPAMTVAQVARVEMIISHWHDERGMSHHSLGVLVGGKVYVNEQLTAAFRPMVEAMAKQVFDMLAAQDAQKSPVVPHEDSVDVVGAGESLNSGSGVDVFDAPKKGK